MGTPRPAAFAPAAPDRPTGARDHRTILSAILRVLRTGAPWRDLPERFGPWSTAWNRFRRWTAAGVWQRVLEALPQQGYRAVFSGPPTARAGSTGERTTWRGQVRRSGRGRPRVRPHPHQIVGDRGYRYPTVRRLLAWRGIRAVIPRRRDQHPDEGGSRRSTTAPTASATASSVS